MLDLLLFFCISLLLWGLVYNLFNDAFNVTRLEFLF